MQSPAPQRIMITLLGVKFSFSRKGEGGDSAVLGGDVVRELFIDGARMTGLFGKFVDELPGRIPCEPAAQEDMFWKLLTCGQEFSPGPNVVRYLERSVQLVRVKFWRYEDLVAITSQVAIRRFVWADVLNRMKIQPLSYNRSFTIYRGISYHRYQHTYR